MGQIVVTPKPEAYINEWRAIEFTEDNWSGVKHLVRHTGWQLSLDLADGIKLVARKNHLDSIETYHLDGGGWIVRSPWDKVYFLPADEFRELFITEELIS